MLFIINLGPASNGFIVLSLGFEWMLIIIAHVGKCCIFKSKPGKEKNLLPCKGVLNVKFWVEKKAENFFNFVTNL